MLFSGSTSSQPTLFFLGVLSRITHSHPIFTLLLYILNCQQLTDIIMAFLFQVIFFSQSLPMVEVDRVNRWRGEENWNHQLVTWRRYKGVEEKINFQEEITCRSQYMTVGSSVFRLWRRPQAELVEYSCCAAVWPLRFVLLTQADRVSETVAYTDNRLVMTKIPSTAGFQLKYLTTSSWAPILDLDPSCTKHSRVNWYKILIEYNGVYGQGYFSCHSLLDVHSLCHSHWRSASAECACRAAEWRSSSISSMPLRVATLVRNGTRRWTQGTKSPYPSSCRGRCTRRRPRRPARRDRPCRRGDDAVNPNDASAPARAFGICRQGQFRPLTDVSKNPYYEPIIPAPAPNHCNCRAQRLASEMPGLRPESPAIPSPELRRVRTSFTGASSWVATTAMGKVVRSANAPVEPKAKVEDVEKQRRRGKGGCNGIVSSARCRSPPPSPVSPELGKTRCSWITVNSGEFFFFLLLCTLINFHPARRNCVLYDLNKIFEKTFQCFILFKKNVLANIQSSAFCAGIIT